MTLRLFRHRESGAWALPAYEDAAFFDGDQEDVAEATRQALADRVAEACGLAPGTLAVRDVPANEDGSYDDPRDLDAPDLIREPEPEQLPEAGGAVEERVAPLTAEEIKALRALLP